MKNKGIKFRSGDERLYNIFSCVLNDWLEQLERYTTIYPHDALYHFNERATLSTLSASFYKNDYFVLEEFSADKKALESPKEDIRYGRIDLYFGKDQYDAIIEAKQKYFTLTELDINNSFKKLHNMYEEAKKDTQSSYEANIDIYDEAFAVSFIIPHINKKNKERTYNLLESFLEKIEDDNILNYDVLAYVFPEKCDVFYGDRYYPGLVCLIKSNKTI